MKVSYSESPAGKYSSSGKQGLQNLYVKSDYIYLFICLQQDACFHMEADLSVKQNIHSISLEQIVNRRSVKRIVWGTELSCEKYSLIISENASRSETGSIGGTCNQTAQTLISLWVLIALPNLFTLPVFRRIETRSSVAANWKGRVSKQGIVLRIA